MKNTNALVESLKKIKEKESDGVKLNRHDRRAKAKIAKQLAKR